MKNLIVRTITGAVFTATIVLSAIYSPILFAVFFLFMAAASQYEFQRLLHKQISIQIALPGIISGMMTYIIIALYSLTIIDAKALLLFFLVLALLVLYRFIGGRKNNPKLLRTELLGIVMLVFPLALLNTFLNPQLIPEYHTPWYVLGMFMILWAHDTFAYLTGSLFGRHPLAKKVSPKKSIEGSIGGFGFALITAYIISIYSPELNQWLWIAIALIVVVFGTLGDLAESLLKRKAGVKDSGTILPGHGGALDRFDSVFFVSPLILILILLSI